MMVDEKNTKYVSEPEGKRVISLFCGLLAAVDANPKKYASNMSNK
jgi:hypothetical protein